MFGVFWPFYRLVHILCIIQFWCSECKLIRLPIKIELIKYSLNNIKINISIKFYPKKCIKLGHMHFNLISVCDNGQQIKSTNYTLQF